MGFQICISYACETTSQYTCPKLWNDFELLPREKPDSLEKEPLYHIYAFNKA